MHQKSKSLDAQLLHRLRMPLTGLVWMPSCAQVMISRTSSSVPYPPAANTTSISDIIPFVHFAKDYKSQFRSSVEKFLEESLPGRAMKASARRAISALRWCMSSTAIRSPTVFPQICNSHKLVNHQEPQFPSRFSYCKPWRNSAWTRRIALRGSRKCRPEGLKGVGTSFGINAFGMTLQEYRSENSEIHTLKCPIVTFESVSSAFRSGCANSWRRNQSEVKVSLFSHEEQLYVGKGIYQQKLRNCLLTRQRGHRRPGQSGRLCPWAQCFRLHTPGRYLDSPIASHVINTHDELLHRTVTTFSRYWFYNGKRKKKQFGSIG